MPDLTKNVCAVCGLPPPEGATACPHDGNTLFIDPSTPKDPLIGQKLGDYTVLEPIGDGGMGLVYRGIQPVIKKRVAIKVLRPEFASDPAQVKRLVAEAEAVNSISHRNIIDIFGLGQLPDGRHYIIMEYLEGDPLDVYLRLRGSLPQLEAVELLIDICGPLFAAHNAGVIHRDLKPSNVYLVRQPDGTRYLKLLDFGLAKKGVKLDGHTSQTSMTQIAGTPDYMAPEQCRGLDISARTDLYALGILGWQMLTGKLPFEGATPMDVMVKHVSSIPEPPSLHGVNISPDVDALIMSLIQKDPEARPANAEVVRTELKRIGKLLLEESTQPPSRQWTGEVPKLTPEQFAMFAQQRQALEAGGEVAPSASPPRPAASPPRPAASPPRPSGAGEPAQTAPTTQETQEQLEPPPPVRRSRRGVTVVAAAIAVAAVVGGGWWLAQLDRTTPVEPSIPVPVPVAQADASVATPVEPVVADAGVAMVEAPVRDAGILRTIPPLGKHPVHELGPTIPELARRVATLEKKLRSRTASGAEPDPSALQLLAKQKLRLASPLTLVERRDVAKKLDSWEHTFLQR